MGNTNKVTTDPQRRQNNADDPLNQAIQMTDACVFKGSGGSSQASGLIPDNGEYSWAGTTGSCAVCSTCAPRRMEKSDGSCDDSLRCGWEGEVPQYKRTGYNAPVDDCCLNGVKTVGNKTCDPKYRDGYATSNCDSTYLNYCNSGTRIFDDPKCVSWINRVGTSADNILNNKCVGDKLTTDICKKWCERNKAQCAANFKSYCKLPTQFTDGSYCKTQSMVPGFEVDDAVQTFCADHADDDFCACFKAVNQASSDAAIKDPTLRAILARPECYVTKCSSGLGYQTSNMRNNLKSSTCPSVNVCQNTLNAMGNTSTDLANITQSCQQSQSVTTGTAGGLGTGAAIAGEGDSFSKTLAENQNLVMFFLFVLVLIFGAMRAYQYASEPMQVPIKTMAG